MAKSQECDEGRGRVREGLHLQLWADHEVPFPVGGEVLELVRIDGRQDEEGVDDDYQEEGEEQATPDAVRQLEKRESRETESE